MGENLRIRSIPGDRGRAGIVARFITFEHPLNERIRTFLRLEHLFKQVDFFLPQEAVWAVRGVVVGLLDIVGITSRSDTKSDLLKELERNSTNLARIRHQRGVDLQVLEQVVAELERASIRLRALEGPIGQSLREHELLKAVAQRSSIPGGSCSFDLPQFHHWLEQPPERWRGDLLGWIQTLQPVRDALGLLLSLTRGSSSARPVTARQGFYQDSLDAQLPHQMLRIAIPQEAGWYPEVSGLKQRFTIRFLGNGAGPRPTQVQADVDFLLTCCVI